MNIIEARGLEKTYGQTHALKGVSFEIKEGEFFGCFGPNGAGKTSLLKILTGQIEATRGDAKVAGVDVKQDPIEIRRRIGIVPEVESPPSYLTSYEFLYFVGRVRGLKNLEKKIDYWLDFFDLQEKRDVVARGMSKGMRQKLMLASAFIHKPGLLFLDEPFINLDPIYQRKLREYLQRIVSEGTTIFMCTHILEIAEKLCTRAMIIDEGKILAFGDIPSLKEDAGGDLENVFMKLVNHSGAVEMDGRET